MTRFKYINFYQNRRIIKLFMQKLQNFQTLKTPPSDLRNSPSIADFRLCGYAKTMQYYAICFAMVYKCDNNYTGTGLEKLLVFASITITA